MKVLTLLILSMALLVMVAHAEPQRGSGGSGRGGGGRDGSRGGSGGSRGRGGDRGDINRRPGGRRERPCSPIGELCQKMDFTKRECFENVETIVACTLETLTDIDLYQVLLNCTTEEVPDIMESLIPNFLRGPGISCENIRAIIECADEEYDLITEIDACVSEN
ncbi:DEAD-box ATP-dependent RNA helicase 11-like [Homarus americanus]|nr:DEAD-box ATP-dependent RNA helicase 11-like [Homarus americanus]